MPTTYTDQFYLIDPYAPPAAGTALNFVVYDLVDQDDDGDVGTAGGDLVNGSDVTGTYYGDTVTVERADSSVVTITGTTFYLANGQRVFTPNDGSVLENVTFISSTWVSPNTQMPVGDLGPACFVRGTLIETSIGPRPIEDLVEGDLVRTRDNGYQPILWISLRRVAGNGNHAPIRICKGALGNSRDLLVSPQHRMLISGWKAEMFFGQDEVLVAAKHLVPGHDMIHVKHMREVEYLHLLLDGHQVIYAEGIPSESFDPGGDFAQLDPIVQAEVGERFPDLIQVGGIRNQTARRVVKAAEAPVLFN